MLYIQRNKDDLLEFKMQTKIEGEVQFYWTDIRCKILSDWKDAKIVAFVDSNVYEMDAKWQELESHHANLHLIPTNLGEGTKNTDSLLACLERIESIGLSRRGDVLLAIGGGVLMDLVSLAASLYRRGVSVIKVPTTLLGFVDASIGIKTGVNFMGQRNRLGSYYLNYDVAYDKSLLQTLDVSHLREGLGEIFKIAIIKSSRLFNLLESNSCDALTPCFYQTPNGAHLIGLAVQLMLEELQDNPTEMNLMRCVDFGHNFSPLLEMHSIDSSDYENVPHGMAVAADCILTSIVAKNRGDLGSSSLERIISLGTALGFFTGNPIYNRVDLMWSSFLEMTRHRAGSQNLPYPSDIGEYGFIQDLKYEEIVLAAQEFNQLGK
jgi:3-dehydroquinate synthase